MPNNPTVDPGEMHFIKQTPIAAPVPSSTPGQAAAAHTGTQQTNQTNQCARTGSMVASPSGTASGSPEDNYPTVGKMESITFGQAQPQMPIEQRLTRLESAVFRKTSSEKSLFDRTQDLKVTLLGAEEESPEERSRLMNPLLPGFNPMNSMMQMNPMIPINQMGSTPDQVNLTSNHFEELAERPENQLTVSQEELERFTIELINAERAATGLNPLEKDELAERVATDQVNDLVKRSLISHADFQGNNPDRRYTLDGGSDAMTESLVALNTPDTLSQSHTKASMVHVVETMLSRQDDRDAVMSSDATNIGFSVGWTQNRDRLVALTEVVTRHGIMHPLSTEAHVGEKIEVKGMVSQPYKFERVSVAWEAGQSLGSAADESEEALPYFPPLDYTAYAIKSDKDYSGALTALRTVGVIAAIAGGVFMPPVAFAAPLIALSGGFGGDPKPASDIPVHGGVKVEGQAFTAKVPLSKDNKSGIYYITVWASMGDLQKPVAISRRAILTKNDSESVTSKVEAEAQESQPNSTQQTSHSSKIDQQDQGQQSQTGQQNSK